MPLVTTGVLLARQVDVDLTATARSVLAATDAARVSIGPFQLAATPDPVTLHVVAWVSALTPRSPEDPGLSPRG